jgi:hypothetical protein
MKFRKHTIGQVTIFTEYDDRKSKEWAEREQRQYEKMKDMGGFPFSTLFKK